MGFQQVMVIISTRSNHEKRSVCTRSAVMGWATCSPCQYQYGRVNKRSQRPDVTEHKEPAETDNGPHGARSEEISRS